MPTLHLSGGPAGCAPVELEVRDDGAGAPYGRRIAPLDQSTTIRTGASLAAPSAERSTTFAAAFSVSSSDDENEASVPACQACGCEGGRGRHSREQRHLGLTEPAIMQRVQGEVVPAQGVFSLPPTTAPLVVWLGDC